jgi:serine/threonine protein kinase
MHLIHFDIKPANISFSGYYNRAVFLDFGLSEVIKEQKGIKTLTGFRGSFAFCSEAMLCLFC